MCGIVGVYSKDNTFKRKLLQMNNLLKHRGPDDEGYICVNTESNEVQSYVSTDTIDAIKYKYPDIKNASLHNFDLLMGHRRLSIIDLSEKGHQPMSDVNNNIWITYNGEIYNYIELRTELLAYGYEFQTQTDTEVILNSYLQWGVQCLNHFNGMWAFALWDMRLRRLFLARDRFGVKPLYYTNTASYFAFSSEIKPLISLNLYNYDIDVRKIPLFLLHGNRLNDNNTFFKGINSLTASHYMIFQDQSHSIKKYYDIPYIPNNTNNESTLKTRLIELLYDSVKLRYRSDVPVGTCLSGGFDSSGIISISNNINIKSINTFSAIWRDKESDESKYIDIINKKFNCLENKIEPSPLDFENVFYKLSYYQELPTDGPGLYPQWFVMKKAQGIVKVLLDGQGGDEVFGGYFTTAVYFLSLIKDMNISNMFRDFYLLRHFINKNGIHNISKLVFPKAYDWLTQNSLARNSNIFTKEVLSLLNKNELIHDIEPSNKFKHFVNNLSYHFIYNITIPNLLHYEDRSSMAHSIESRVPFLDYRLVEFGLNLAPYYLINKEIPRYLYRNALQEFIPKAIIERKDKLGFPTPFRNWIRNPLKNYVNDNLVLDNSPLHDYMVKKQIIKRINLHNEGKKDYSWEIWKLLSLNAFLNLYKNHFGIKKCD